MAQKLRVPPPPSGRSNPRSGSGKRRQAGTKRPSRSAKAPRRKTSRWLLPLVAVLLVGSFVLAGCLLPAALPDLSLGGDGGRTNVLLLGIDRRGGSDWAYRTDTIMVVGLDPGSRGAAVLSIPRDLQVTIPGYGEDRINTANVYGYVRDYRGGGPALLQATIEANFGIPIDGYLMFDFAAFEQIVDALGGIDLDVEEPLHDTRYPDPRPGDPHAYKTIHFDAGPQHMDGKRALEYARSRMSTSDFDRARRQQEILLAIRRKVLSLGAIPRWPSLAAVILEAVKTDLGLGEMLSLGLSSVRTDPASVEQVVLKSPYVVSHRRNDGAAVQLPNWELINPLLAELFDLPAGR